MIEILLLVLLLLFLALIILFTVVPILITTITFSNDLNDMMQIITFITLYILLSLQVYVIFYEIIYKNMNSNIVKALIFEYDVIMISILCLAYLITNCAQTTHVWSIPVSLYLFELIFLFFGFDAVYPKLFISKWFYLSFIIIYSLSILTIYMNTFFDKLSRDTILFSTSKSHDIYYQPWLRSLIFPIICLSLSPIKNIVYDILNIDSITDLCKTHHTKEKLNIFSKHSLSQLHKIQTNSVNSPRPSNSSKEAIASDIELISSKSDKETNKYLVTNSFYFLHCGIYKIPESLTRARRISSSCHLITKKLPNTVIVQTLSPSSKIGITANNETFKQFTQQLITEVPAEKSESESSSINELSVDNSNGIIHINNNDINDNIKSEQKSMPKYLWFTQWIASISFTIYMILVMTAHEIPAMLNWLQIPCWCLLSTTYIFLFISFYNNVNYSIMQYILSQPKVLALMYLHGMHCYTDIVYGWSNIALSDCIEGLSFFFYFFGFDAMEFRVNHAAQLAALTFFAATLMDSIIAMTDINTDEPMFEIMGYHFYKDAERHSIFLSMAILSAKALWTMIQDPNKLVWVTSRRKKRDTK